MVFAFWVKFRSSTQHAILSYGTILTATTLMGFLPTVSAHAVSIYSPITLAHITLRTGTEFRMINYLFHSLILGRISFGPVFKISGDQIII